MTRDKAQKIATRQRMAQTGEPYSVARKAAEDRAGDPGAGETAEERYVREAQEAGVSTADAEALRFGFRAPERADQLRQAADQAREQAEQAEESAVQAEERAELAQEAADLAQDWADGDEQRLRSGRR
jgi:hypothetical protein